MERITPENALNEIEYWIDDIGGQLYAKVHEFHRMVNRLNKLQAMVRDFRDRQDGFE